MPDQPSAISSRLTSELQLRILFYQFIIEEFEIDVATIQETYAAYKDHMSCRAGFHLFKDYFSQHDYDIIAVTETWLTQPINNELISLNNYTLLRSDRSDGRRAGGVAIYLKNNISYSIVFSIKHKQLLLLINVNNGGIAGITIRTGGKVENNYQFSVRLVESIILVKR
ncbi:hypothetical protein QE152_g23114 [Popillia japonica]|uniref:Endonuclease/exonuclease/phosphatase domain-containing protein n=1 Tax=Popillia japonica TaxID=7064 RepID=A0AAW1KGM2_POPJA